MSIPEEIDPHFERTPLAVATVGLAALDSPAPLDQGSRWLRTLLVALDFVGAGAAWVGAYALGGDPLWPQRLGRLAIQVTVLSVVTVAVLSAFHLYRSRVCAARTVELTRLAQAAAICAFGAALLARTQYIGPPPKVDLLGGTYTFLILACLRACYSSWLRTCRARGLYCRWVCILGTNEDASALLDLVGDHPELGYRVAAVLGPPHNWVATGSRVPTVEPGRDLVRAVRKAGASGVLIAASAVDSQDLDTVVRQLVAGGLHVQISTGLGRIDQHRVRAIPLSNQLVFYVERRRLSTWQAVLKRTMDILLGSLTLILALPVMATAALAIKFDDGGPVLYCQQRVGRGGRTFRLYKLRTMVPNASRQMADLAGRNERNGPLFKLSFDPRVTRVGRLLRASSIDELPQLFNVLRGQMSLVGPRPALPSEVAQFDHQLTERSSVLPGITGLWQIEARDNPSFSSYRRLDLFYVDNWSPMMDLTILFATAATVFGRAFRGVRGRKEMDQTGDGALAAAPSASSR